MRVGRTFLWAIAATALALSGWGTASNADEAKPALELTGRVVDEADILSAEFEARLSAKLAKLEDDTLVQLVVATTPSLNGYDIEGYSLDLARAWGLGDRERNDGLLVLVAPNDRKLRIEVGRGLEDSVKDEEAAAIITTDIIPEFTKGDYEQGLDRAVDSLIREVTPIEVKKAA